MSLLDGCCRCDSTRTMSVRTRTNRAGVASGSSRARRTSLTLIPVPRRAVISMACSTCSNRYER